MSRSIASSIVRADDGTAVGQWGRYALKSAFQPIFAFESGRLAPVAFEALLRPFTDGEALAPLNFLGSLPLDERIVVENLLHALHLTNAATCLPGDASIFLNFDPSVFTDHAVADMSIHEMRATLSRIGLDPHRIVCEVTEKETVSQEALFSLVASLRASGFGIAVDDYGADDSDMARVRDLHPDIVKFDARWIARLMDSGPGYALLATMVSTFAAQGIRTVFEGIEEGWQVELAEKTGVAMLQGFALARPEIAPTSFAGMTRNGASATAGHASGDPANSPPSGDGGGRGPKAFGRRTRQP
ncbi:EAL domain-containing protein [Mesorhizobium marinum]|uniref:EAL domain-containing protein n=1 Tax=Mesorhizobium marinum TaxID=3228790 RepID=UPI0034671DC6